MKICAYLIATAISYSCFASDEIEIRKFRSTGVMNDESCKAFKNPSYPSITSISYMIQKIEHEYPDLSKVKLLDLSYNYIDDRAITSLKPFLNKLNNLEVLDLSFNRGFTANGLKEFKDLLLKHSFKYLVIAGSSASTLEDIREVATFMSQTSGLTPDTLAKAVQKIIFLHEGWIPSFETQSRLPVEYINAHKNYYASNKKSLAFDIEAHERGHTIPTLAIKDIKKPTPVLKELIQQALKNDPEACYRLGIHYYSGEDMNKDYHKAFYWQKKAADAGHLPAMYQLRYMYQNGCGIKKDLGVADNLWLRMTKHKDWPKYRDYYLSAETSY
jgi:hypothetical protein